MRDRAVAIFYGPAKNIIDANIRECTPLQRSQIDKLLFRVLSSCGLRKEHNIINSNTARLHNMTISNTFAVAMVAPWAFRTVLGMDHHTITAPAEGKHELLLHTLYKYRELLLETQYLPSTERDGLLAVQAMNDMKAYHKKLNRLCTNYAECINQLCVMDVQLGRELDKPNVHRVVELYHHSVPRYGHVCVFDELSFEAAHQPLKRGLGRSNHQLGHMYSMRAVLANECKSRIGQVCSSIPLSGE